MERRSGEKLIDEIRLSFREITNPLTAIMGLSRQLFASRSPQVVSEIASTIYDESFELDLHLRNIYAAAELEAGHAALRPSNVNVNSLLMQVVNTLRHRASVKNVRVDHLPDLSEEPEWSIICRTDAEKLQLVLLNLLAIAIEFSRRGASISVEAFKDNGFLNIAVHDICKGASREKQRSIIDLFKQLEAGERSPHFGPGVGLSVTRSLIGLLNGRISLFSEKGRGYLCKVLVPDMEEHGMADFLSRAPRNSSLKKG